MELNITIVEMYASINVNYDTKIIQGIQYKILQCKYTYITYINTH